MQSEDIEPEWKRLDEIEHVACLHFPLLLMACRTGGLAGCRVRGVGKAELEKTG